MLCGKLALVTGGGSGIGRATCLALTREGARVVSADLQKDAAQRTVEQLRGDGHMAVQLDVSSAEDVEKAWNSILTQYKEPPTVVVNSAGIIRDNFLLKMPLNSFNEVINTNLTGTFNVVQKACRQLVESQLNGSIINLASIVGQTGNISQANYSASKAGVEALTKTVAKEMGMHGIRCNAVVPGFIESPMTESIPEKVKDMFRKRIALGRFGQPQEIAQVITFLASDWSSYITGASISVTGGL
ncbi:estradiol 17-beta-dehydrogenase 8-like [Cimex lectularius]|uniref:(3R)-3-hydroxyacyl-CoA dehydrogenase n=1 Tax=Cimex lectularius TaxID=79782 RepID=A0A8I6TBR6_CIMLE|nr:estradiol 17-beta-dehydrogenase 8-like [Cimex lectularius]